MGDEASILSRPMMHSNVVEHRERLLLSAFAELRLLRNRKLKYLASCPHTGGGQINHWIMGAACLLRKHRVPDGTMDKIIRVGMHGCGRDARPGEIERAINSSKHYVDGARKTQMTRRSRWPEANPELIKTIVRRRAFSKRQLEEASVIKPSQISTFELLKILFPGNPFITVGSKSRARTRPLEFLAPTLQQNEHIVPSPMKGRLGKTTDGHFSERCNDNVLRRRFLIIEADNVADPDIQATVLWYLQDYLPLVLVVFSGNESYHGWYLVENIQEPVLEKFMAHACLLGADKSMWSLSQWTRMPNGRNSKTGGVQVPIYFNPHPLA